MALAPLGRPVKGKRSHSRAALFYWRPESLLHESQEPRRHPTFVRSLRRGKPDRSRSGTAQPVARIEQSEIRDGHFGFLRRSRVSLRSTRATKRKNKRKAERRETPVVPAAPCGQRAPWPGALASRRSTCGSRWAGATSQLSCRPCFLGRGGSVTVIASPPGEDRNASPRALPAPACPSPGFNTHSGHRAGGLMPKAARVQK